MIFDKSAVWHQMYFTLNILPLYLLWISVLKLVYHHHISQHKFNSSCAKIWISNSEKHYNKHRFGIFRFKRTHIHSYISLYNNPVVLGVVHDLNFLKTKYTYNQYIVGERTISYLISLISLSSILVMTDHIPLTAETKLSGINYSWMSYFKGQSRISLIILWGGKHIQD